MTATLGYSASRRPRAHGIDRLVMRASMAALLWARRRADRAALTHETHERLRAQHVEVVRREHEAALRAARVR